MTKVIWLTGLSGSGKSTIAKGLKKHIANSVLLDGENIRKGLCSDLGFSAKDRNENIRRISEAAKLLYDSGVTCIVATISPFKKLRDYARSLIPEGDFIEIYVNTPLEVCEKRDDKGLYKKARNHEISEFTGISSPYEPPENSEIIINTSGNVTVEKNVELILNYCKFVSVKKAHHVFVGRWCPFHKGHFEIMRVVYEEDPRPLLILIRDTLYDKYSAEIRKKMVEEGLTLAGIPFTTIIVPDIFSVNYGRKVGYKVKCINVDEEKNEISGTDIINKKNNWKRNLMPGVYKYL